MIIEKFSRRRPRKFRDNHSKTSNRASCVPNSFSEKAENLKCAFSWALFSFTSEQIFHCSEENNANPRKKSVLSRDCSGTIEAFLMVKKCHNAVFFIGSPLEKYVKSSPDPYLKKLNRFCPASDPYFEQNLNR